MNNQTEKNLSYYMNLPYEVVIVACPPDEGGWYAKIPLLDGCMTFADTWQELGEMIEDAKLCWLEGAIKDNDSIPEPPVKETIK